MKYLLEIADNMKQDAEKLFSETDFIEQFQVVAPNEITNLILLEGIEAYESGKTTPAHISFADLKKLIRA